MKTELYSQNTE